jgi:aryl-alcohol dehydrogenase-like predicted oxidoreductase
MRYTTMGRTDLSVSVIALGCGNFGGIGSAPELYGQGEGEAAAFALMDCARERGITLFDTANAYGGGRSEDMIGRWLTSRGSRDDIVLTTKVRNRVGPRPQDEGLSAAHIHEQIDASLRRLQTDHVDLYLAHEPDPAVPIEETIGAFDALVTAGKIRHYGLSNDTGTGIQAAVKAAGTIGATVAANLQNGYSLLDRVTADDVFDACAAHGIGFTAFSPLAGGWLSGKYRSGQPFPTGSRMTLRPEPYATFTNDETYAVIDALAAAADGRGVPLSTLALAWAVTDPGVTAVIVGPRNPEQLVEMVAALDVPLDSQDRADLVAMASPHNR